MYHYVLHHTFAYNPQIALLPHPSRVVFCRLNLVFMHGKLPCAYIIPEIYSNKYYFWQSFLLHLPVIIVDGLTCDTWIVGFEDLIDD